MQIQSSLVSTLIIIYIFYIIIRKLTSVNKQSSANSEGNPQKSTGIWELLSEMIETDASGELSSESANSPKPTVKTASAPKMNPVKKQHTKSNGYHRQKIKPKKPYRDASWIKEERTWIKD